MKFRQITGTSNIGGINQPIIRQQQNRARHSLKDGEVERAGRIDRADRNEERQRDSRAIAQIPSYPVSSSRTISNEVEEDEVLIVLTPHIIRFPSISADNLSNGGCGNGFESARQSPESRNRRTRPIRSSRPRRSPAVRKRRRLPGKSADAGDGGSPRSSISNPANGDDEAGDDGTTRPGRFERERSLFDSAADSLQPSGHSGGRSAQRRIPVRQANTQEIAHRATDRPAEGRYRGFGDAPAKYARRERLGHAAGTGDPRGRSGQLRASRFFKSTPAIRSSGRCRWFPQEATIQVQ